MKLYGTYRMKYTQSNDRQSISYFFDLELEDYLQAGLMSIKDCEVGDEQYTGELAPGLKSKTKFFVAEYNETYIPVEQFEMVKQKIINDFYGIILSVDDARAWIEANTSLVKIEDGKYEIHPELEELGETIPAKYLFIN